MGWYKEFWGIYPARRLELWAAALCRQRKHEYECAGWISWMFDFSVCCCCIIEWAVGKDISGLWPVPLHSPGEHLCPQGTASAVSFSWAGPGFSVTVLLPNTIILARGALACLKSCSCSRKISIKHQRLQKVRIMPRIHHCYWTLTNLYLPQFKDLKTQSWFSIWAMNHQAEHETL